MHRHAKTYILICNFIVVDPRRADFPQSLDGLEEVIWTLFFGLCSFDKIYLDTGHYWLSSLVGIFLDACCLDAIILSNVWFDFLVKFKQHFSFWHKIVWFIDDIWLLIYALSSVLMKSIFWEILGKDSTAIHWSNSTFINLWHGSTG